MKFLRGRLGEASTWAGFGVAFAASVPLLPSPHQEFAVVGALVSGLMAALFKEKGSS